MNTYTLLQAIAETLDRRTAHKVLSMAIQLDSQKKADRMVRNLYDSDMPKEEKETKPNKPMRSAKTHKRIAKPAF